MRPKISMGSMPVWPTLCALMAQVTNASSTTMTLGTAPSPSAKHASSATAATASAASPAVRRRRRRAPGAAASSAAVGEAASTRATATEPRVSRTRETAFGRMFFAMTPTPQPIITPIPRLDTMPCAAATSQSPAAVPPTTMPKLPMSTPAHHTATAPVPTRKPTARSMGERYTPNATPGRATLPNSREGMAPNPSRSAVNRPASPMAPNSFLPVEPPESPATSVCAAAWPMGYSSSASSMKCRRSRAVHTRPSTTPASATASIWNQSISVACPSIQAPGMVKASPPATMAPADMTVCVTFASLRFVCPRAFRKNREMMAAKMMGQGSAPILRAV